MAAARRRFLRRQEKISILKSEGMLLMFLDKEYCFTD
jgi:hypothetical protein